MQRGNVTCPRSHSSVSLARLPCGVAADKHRGLEVHRVSQTNPPFKGHAFLSSGFGSGALTAAAWRGAEQELPPGSCQLPSFYSLCPHQAFPSNRGSECVSGVALWPPLPLSVP